jgi:hypothetical protein
MMFVYSESKDMPLLEIRFFSVIFSLLLSRLGESSGRPLSGFLSMEYYYDKEGVWGMSYYMDKGWCAGQRIRFQWKFATLHPPFLFLF